MPYDYVPGPLERAPGSRSSKRRNFKKFLFLLTVLKYEDEDPGAVQLRPRGVDTFRYRKGICTVDCRHDRSTGSCCSGASRYSSGPCGVDTS